MEEQEVKNIKAVKNLLVWQVPLFVIPLALWIFNIAKIIADTFVQEKIISIIFYYSNPLFPLISPFGLIFFLAWLILGLLGLRTSVKYLKTATKNKKIGKTLFVVSIIMLILVTLTLINYCYYLIT